MDDSFLMRRFQCFANTLRNVEGFFDTNWTTRDAIGER
jgi:hypothetical protein